MKSIQKMLAIGFNILLLAFVAADHQFAVGDYTVDSDTATGMVIIRNGHDGPTVILGTYSAGENKEHARAKLVFNRYGNHFFLSQVWPAGATGREVTKSRQEVETAKTVSRPEVLTVISAGASH